MDNYFGLVDKNLEPLKPGDIIIINDFRVEIFSGYVILDDDRNYPHLAQIVYDTETYSYGVYIEDENGYYFDRGFTPFSEILKRQSVFEKYVIQGVDQ